MSLKDKVTIDLSRRGTIHVPAKQDDRGYNIIVTILQDGVNIVDFASDTAKFRLQKPDGTAYFDDATVKSDNTVSIHVDDDGQMLAVPGYATMDVTLFRGGAVKSTQNFVLDIEAAPGGSAIESSSEFIELRELIQDANAKIEDAEAWAVGERAGVPVEAGDPTYHNNAKYYAQSILGKYRFGVSGIGQSAANLNRIWDSVGMIAQVGTDGDNSGIINNFDSFPPFNRRKCVGNWTLVDGRPHFNVLAYLGDDDYAEDGTMGDYVAVECPKAYYYFQDGVLGVSAYPIPGWRVFDVFCRDHDQDQQLDVIYIPAYALAMKDGHAVSLPGLPNEQLGSFMAGVEDARTYNNADVAAYGIMQPMAVYFYEWALYTVEFATQNCQSIMQGCASLRHNNDDRATLRSDGKWLLGNYQAGRVAGEYISLQETSVDINAVSAYASHRITSIIRCDADGTPNASGSYQLMETEDLGSGRTYTIGSSYRIAARAWYTGSCSGVSTPSGSPVSNSSGYYPMQYRWRENVFSNQNKTIADLFNARVGTGDADYTLNWYYLPDPTDYTPSATSKPDATDLASEDFVLLDVTTPHENYVNGYIVSREYSALYPDIWIPGNTTGGSGSTYFADYAYLVFSNAVRAVRVGGPWYYGAYVGFSFVYGYYAPSIGYANYGADLFFLQ